MQTRSRLIVIGASAGGVAALLQIAPRLAPRLAAPILLVLHIGKHRSRIAELLTACGPNPAVIARDGVEPAPGSIYVAAPDHHLLLEDGRLRLFRGPKEHHARPAINPLFRSVALECGPRAIGVILTGMLDDGAAGLHAIKACGGTVVVQDPSDSVEPGMPTAALESVDADHVVRVADMAALLNGLAQPLTETPIMNPPDWLRTEHEISAGKAGIQAISTIGAPSSYTCPDCGGALFEVADRKPLRFICHTGHAFSLRSLALTQEEVADEALWTGLRALQEKSSILHRLADLQEAESPGSEAGVAEEARLVDEYSRRMRQLVTSAPASVDLLGESVEAE